jgi:hypothetical protein
LVAPEFTGRKAHRIHVLRFFTQELGVRVREDKHAVVPGDAARFAVHIARQARVTQRINVAREPAGPL